MDKIPSELLIKIFQFIDSTRILVRCRAVSKLWNTAATNAMSNRTIDISSIGQAWKFYDFLLMDTSGAKMLKSIYFGHLGIFNVELKRRILRLVFTQSMDSIRGYHCCDDFYLDLINIAKNGLNGKYNMQVIPHPTIDGSSYYNDAVIMFQEYLQDVYLGTTLLKGANAMQDAVEYLTRFQNLISFGAHLHDADALNTLMNIITEFPRIELITLYVSSTWNSSNTLITGLQGLNQQSITSTIKKLRLYTDLAACTKLIIPHFSNLTSIEICIEDDIDRHSFIEMINMLKTVPHYIFEFSIDDRYSILQNFLDQIPDDVELDSISKCKIEFNPPIHEWEGDVHSYLIRLKR